MKIDEFKNTILFSPLIRIIPDRLYLRLHFRISVGYKLNLKNPRSFNEKIQYLKLHDRKVEYTNYVDKIEAKKYLSTAISDEYIIPTIGVYNSFDDIDFSKLPDSFVVKTSHDSGGVVVCNDKKNFDIDRARKIINRSMKRNYFYLGREWPYKNIIPKVFVEENISKTSDIIDYKFLCFNGKVDCIFTCTNRGREGGLKVTFFDREWVRLPFIRHYPSDDNYISKPINFDKMVEITEKLCKDIAFARIDFFEVDARMYIGEITLYPGSGFEEFTPREWDFALGEKLDVSLFDK